MTAAAGPHGWLVIDKPLGLSSAAVVARVKRALKAGRAGHGGTLDPLASGVLPIALGEATKTVGYILDARKGYRFTVRWGETRDTGDAEGAVTATSPRRPDEAAIRAALPGFLGEIQQVPPSYSAIKQDGRRAYALAREGKAVTLPARRVLIEAFDLTRILSDDEAEFEVRCGKGTYVRSLARDLALCLETEGYVAALRRVRAGPFDETPAISLALLDGLGHSAVAEYLLSVEAALVDIPAIALNAAEAERLRTGRSIEVQQADGGLRRARANDKLVALVEVAGGQARPMRVFNL